MELFQKAIAIFGGGYFKYHYLTSLNSFSLTSHIYCLKQILLVKQISAKANSQYPFHISNEQIQQWEEVARAIELSKPNSSTLPSSPELSSATPTGPITEGPAPIESHVESVASTVQPNDIHRTITITTPASSLSVAPPPLTLAPANQSLSTNVHPHPSTIAPTSTPPSTIAPTTPSQPSATSPQPTAAAPTAPSVQPNGTSWSENQIPRTPAPLSYPLQNGISTNQTPPSLDAARPPSVAPAVSSAVLTPSCHKMPDNTAAKPWEPPIHASRRALVPSREQLAAV